MSWLRRAEAAEYCRVSLATFDRKVKDGALPRPDRTLGVPRWRTDWLDGGVGVNHASNDNDEAMMAAALDAYRSEAKARNARPKGR